MLLLLPDKGCKYNPHRKLSVTVAVKEQPLSVKCNYRSAYADDITKQLML